jgi:hypothetical protein
MSELWGNERMFLIVLILYSVLFAFLWGWGIVHAFLTPHVAGSRRGLWMLAMILNPISAMWYWYVWKRWAFWILFAPAILFVLFLPLTLRDVILTFAVRDLADKFVNLASAFLTHVVYALPLGLFIPVCLFPFALRFAALAHLGANSELEAADRNDQSITFALPVFGFGAAMAYCFTWRRVWAVCGLVWIVVMTGILWFFVRNAI